MQKQTVVMLKKALGESGRNTDKCSNEQWEQRRCDLYNASQGDLTGDNCDICRNRGYIAKIADGMFTFAECKCMEVRRCISLIRESGLAESFRKNTFKAFEAGSLWQRNMKSAAGQYLTDWRGKWFCALGEVGSGKTHICTAICGSMLRKGIAVKYMKWRSDGAQLKGYANNAEVYQGLITPFKKAEVLYIDDFFKGDVSPGDKHLAFDLLNERYLQKNTATIISSELSVDAIMEYDEAIGSRIYEKSRDYCVQIYGQGKNWRLRP